MSKQQTLKLQIDDIVLRVNKIGDWSTAHYTIPHTDKNVAAIILPGTSTGQNSFAECDINEQGCLTRPLSTKFIRDSVFLELLSPQWRKLAEENMRTWDDMSHHAGVCFGLEASLDDWAANVEETYLRFMLGGDICCQNCLNIFCNVAEAHPEKQFWITSCQVECMNQFYATAFADDVPKNLQIYAESPMSDNLFWANFPLMKYDESAEVTEFEIWPDGKSFKVRMSESTKGLFNRGALEWQSWVETELHKRRKHE